MAGDLIADISPSPKPSAQNPDPGSGSRRDASWKVAGLVCETCQRPLWLLEATRSLSEEEEILHCLYRCVKCQMELALTFSLDAEGTALKESAIR